MTNQYYRIKIDLSRLQYPMKGNCEEDSEKRVRKGTGFDQIEKGKKFLENKNSTTTRRKVRRLCEKK